MIDDNIFGVAESVKCFMATELQKRGLDLFFAQSIANMCGTWFIRGYEYKMKGDAQLVFNFEEEKNKKQ